MTPDLAGNALRLRVNVSSLDRNLRVEASATAQGVAVRQVAGYANTELFLPIASPHPWTPDDPFLYDLTVVLKRQGAEVDRITSYFGMRSVELLKAPDGFTRIALNGRPIFQMGALDQGFWPDGLYTAPTDEALRHDIEFLKSSGFNLVRKHVKVEPERWYYWCDRPAPTTTRGPDARNSRRNCSA
jgi:beta-galactosidase/beta-glucuronidase